MSDFLGFRQTRSFFALVLAWFNSAGPKHTAETAGALKFLGAVFVGYAGLWDQWSSAPGNLRWLIHREWYTGRGLVRGIQVKHLGYTVQSQLVPLFPFFWEGCLFQVNPPKRDALFSHGHWASGWALGNPEEPEDSSQPASFCEEWPEVLGVHLHTHDAPWMKTRAWAWGWRRGLDVERLCPCLVLDGFGEGFHLNSTTKDGAMFPLELAST